MGRYGSDPRGEWEGYRDHADRIEREKAEAAEKNLCPVIVNDEWAHGYTKRKVCCKKPSSDALQLDLTLCGTHLKQHLKGEREMAEVRAQRAQAKKDGERRERIQKARDAQQEAIEQLLLKRGFKEVDVYRTGWSRDRKWVVQIPLNVAFELVDELPMITPDEAGEVEEERIRAEETVVVQSAEVPF